MRWIITRDVIGDEAHVVGAGKYPERDAVRNLTGEERKAAVANVAKHERWKYEIRLSDDDGNLYYEGLVGDLDNASEGPAFAPLDWAEANAGCTYMEYRRRGTNEKWKVL
jgi:hypothetical protein